MLYVTRQAALTIRKTDNSVVLGCAPSCHTVMAEADQAPFGVKATLTAPAPGPFAAVSSAVT